MSEQLEYLIACLDLYLGGGHPPVEAWTMAVENYAYVFHGKEGAELSRSAERMLEAIADEPNGTRSQGDSP